MRAFLFCATIAFASSCSPPRDDLGLVSVNACPIVASQVWRPLSGAEFTLEAFTSGPDCARAVATLVVRDAQDRVLWAEAAPTEHIMTLAQAHEQDAMRAALGEWINPANNTTMQTTSALPDWPARADAPTNGEFPFYPESYLDRDSYLALRQADVPLLCFVQGMESLACLALRNGQLEKIGVQTFPG